ncbi:ATP-dependent DNA helicase, putative [Trypanosoma brucei gambiense DAL972]|nr:ATP-dependent DNA helicase, putative [Trypanosoma brucei gambiense DAL972]RHW67519.1 ATP-dependent DNA helicase [Trypanosoma brucei equiperdum]CBH18287.1 ATP-dependent DNA helicase, putative [Trypanosoma brucei gambiense DAL972]|eukprot:XP_011780551.1 ATP-dependent DNA helicase, putative [Trypanosoma brucei gambiense DAL972]
MEHEQRVSEAGAKLKQPDVWPVEIEQILSALDNSQRVAVCENPSQPLLIIAGAGSGKTLTMASRIAFLILNNVAPQNILGLCFSRQAAETLRGRVASVLPPAMAGLAQKLKLKTFHAFGLECLRRYACIELTTEVYDARRQRDLAFTVVEKHAQYYKGVEAVVTLIDYVNKAKTKKDMRAGTELDPSRQPAYLFRFYESMLHEELNAVDFGDLEQRFLKALRPVRQRNDATSEGNNNSNSSSYSISADASSTLQLSPMAIQLRSQYTHFVVDEFQDLNEVQLECLALLAGDECRVTCVGDPNQCIYAWRGATAESFNLWRSRFPRSVIMKLETNYRSSAEIVCAVNQVTHLEQSSHKGQSGTNITLVKCKYAWEQLKLIPRIIERLRGRDRSLPYGSIAVLCRTHRTVRELVTALENDGIPVTELRRGAPNSVALVRALLSYLRLCIHPHSNVDVECVIRDAPNHFAAPSATKFIFALQAEALTRRLHLTTEQQLEGHYKCSYYTILRELVHNGFATSSDRLRTTKPQQKLLRTIIEVTAAAHEALSRFYCNIEDVVRSVAERAGFDDGSAGGAKIRHKVNNGMAGGGFNGIKRAKRPRCAPRVAAHLTDSVDVWEDVMNEGEEIMSSIPQLLLGACEAVQEQIIAEQSAVEADAINGDVLGFSDNRSVVKAEPDERSVGTHPDVPAAQPRYDPYTVLQRVIDEFLQLLPSDDFGPMKGPEALKPEERTVTVTTVHQAKGKEWPAVIIPCCYEGEFPIDTRKAEEKRVFYVAMSRAMESLVFLTAEQGPPTNASGRTADGDHALDSTGTEQQYVQLQMTPYLRPILHQVKVITMSAESEGQQEWV